MARNEVDMFSYLSDSLLFIIISFLPFKEAARTSILSKRWRHIWRATKNIELEETFFVNNREESSEIKENQKTLFLDFAKNWIQNYAEPIAHKFCLVFSNPNGDHILDIQNFIQFAIGRKVTTLELDFSDPTWNEDSLDNHEAFFELPLFVYQHSKLESIKLFSCKFRVPEFGNFRALKSIYLGWIQLPTSSFAALLSNCALLEDLNLKKCWDLGQLDICAPNLRTLVIDKCLSLGGGVRVDAQKLSVFKYSGPLIAFEFLDLNSVVEADLDFGLEYEFNDDCGEILYRLLTEICCIRVLSVCSYMLQVIPNAEEPLSLQPPLNEVEHLTLKTALDMKEYYGITFFLHSCPGLETLCINLDAPTRIFNEQNNCWLQEGSHQFLDTSDYVIVYGCIERRLKVVEVKGFKGGINELLVIQYFIKYGRVLEKLYINISNDKGENGEDLGLLLYRQNAMKLLSVNRASPNLLILIR